METRIPDTLPEKIVELQQQIELDELNFKYAVQLRKNPIALIQMKERIKHSKARLENLVTQLFLQIPL